MAQFKKKYICITINKIIHISVIEIVDYYMCLFINGIIGNLPMLL